MEPLNAVFLATEIGVIIATRMNAPLLGEDDAQILIEHRADRPLAMSETKMLAFDGLGLSGFGSNEMPMVEIAFLGVSGVGFGPQQREPVGVDRQRDIGEQREMMRVGQLRIA